MGSLLMNEGRGTGRKAKERRRDDRVRGEVMVMTYVEFPANQYINDPWKVDATG